MVWTTFSTDNLIGDRILVLRNFQQVSNKMESTITFHNQPTVITCFVSKNSWEGKSF